MEGRDIGSLYSDVFKQTGGKNKTKDDVYIPKDSSHKTQSDLSKLFKANRLLQKELNETKAELKKEKQKTSTLEKKLKASGL